MLTNLVDSVQHTLHSATQGMSIGTVVVLTLVALVLLRSVTHRPKRRKATTVDREALQEEKATPAQTQRSRLVRRFVRRAGATLGFALVYPLGSRLGNRRVEVIDGAFRVMVQAIDQAGHRRSRAVCLPGLVRARWLVKCDGCGQFFTFKEARSLVNGDEHSLRILSGLTVTEKGHVRAQACQARFVEGTPAQQPAAVAHNLTVHTVQPVSTSATTVAQVNVASRKQHAG